jgi:NitT/TauT family transport system substrate-binding protein
MPAYRAIADLKGRKIAVTSPGSTSNMVASVMLARAGVLPHEVSYVEAGTVASALAAVRSGQVDAISHTEPVMTMLENRSEVRIVADTRTLKGTQELFGGAMPSACLYAPGDYVQRNPAIVQALTNAVVHALKWLQTAGPSDIIKVVPESHLLGDRGLYLAGFSKVREAYAIDGLFSDEGVRTALRAAARIDSTLRADKIDLGRTFSNDFSRKAKDKFRA